MSLRYSVTAEEHGGLDEGIKGLYTEKDGGFVLSVEGIEDTSGLKSALTKERDLAKEYKKQVAAWEALGKKPEEISEILKQLEKQKTEPPKANPDDKGKDKDTTKDSKDPNPFEELAKKVEAQLAAQQAEMAALRKEQAEKNEREKKRERDARVYKEFEEYPEEQKAALAKLVEGDKDEEIAESVKSVKALFPLPPKAPPRVGGASNPPKKTPDTESEAVKAARALAEKKINARNTLTEILKNT
jgi:hypothetical protein